MDEYYTPLFTKYHHYFVKERKAAGITRAAILNDKYYSGMTKWVEDTYNCKITEFQLNFENEEDAILFKLSV